MVAPAHATFGQLLTHHMRAARLTKPDLVRRAHLSRRTITYLEQDRIRRPQRATVQLLADALGLAGDARREFEEAAHGRGPALAAPRHNLPRPLTSFIGRAEAQAELRQLLTQPDTPLVTLVGPGGCGKTRLALQVARQQLAAFPDGVWLVDLAPLTAPEQVPVAVATALGVHERAAMAVLTVVLATLRHQRLLLVLDNVEYHLGACADLVAALVAACPHLRLLVTSRQPLGVAGEVCWPVPPLSLPLAAARPTVDAVLHAEAGQLFVARARLVRPDFAVTVDTAAAITNLCHQLDGLPLALELIAARCHDQPVTALAAHTRSWFNHVPSRVRGIPARQQTVRATVDWSYRLLDPTAQAVLRRLAIFEASWTLDAAAAVCADAALPPATVTATIASLSQASLVQVAAAGDPAPYRLLATIRTYALDHLASAGETTAVASRYLGWVLARASVAAPHLVGGLEQARWLGQLDRDYAHYRAALTWAATTDPPRGLRLAALLHPYWLVRQAGHEGKAYLRAFLSTHQAPDADRAEALTLLGTLLVWDDVPAAHHLLAEAVALGQAGEQPRLVALALPYLIYTLVVLGDLPAVTGHLAVGRALLAVHDDARLRGLLLAFEGYAVERAGQPTTALHLLDQAYALGQQTYFPLLCCIALARIGMIEAAQGALPRAAASLTTLLTLATAAGARYYQTLAQNRLGLVAEYRGDLAAAQAAYQASQALAEAGGDRPSVGLALAGQGRVAVRRGEAGQAVALLRQSVRETAPLADPRVRAEALRFLWLACWRHDERGEALTLLQECVASWQASGHQRGLLEVLETVVQVAAGDVPAAALGWLGSCDALRRALALPRLPIDGQWAAQVVQDAEAALGAAAAAAHLEQGAALPLSAALAEAVAWVVAARSKP